MRRGVHLLALLGLSGCASLPPIDVPSAAQPEPQPAAPTAVAVALPATEALDATEARPLPLGHDLVITTADGGRATVGIHEVRAGRRAMAILAELDPGHRPPAAGMRFYYPPTKVKSGAPVLHCGRNHTNRRCPDVHEAYVHAESRGGSARAEC